MPFPEQLPAQVMVKLKNGRHVDPRQSLAVDSAYLACKPPDRAHTKQSRHPPARRYMRHLIHDRLDETHLKQVLPPLSTPSTASPQCPTQHSPASAPWLPTPLGNAPG